MKNKKIILGVSSFFLIASLLTTGCGKEVNLSSKAVVGFEDGEISINDYYKEISENNISILVDMIDHKLFDEKYKSDKDEDENVQGQIDQIKEYYPDEDSFAQVIQQYFGANDEDELEELLRLEYKREEYHNLYDRSGIQYKQGKLCPYYKKVAKGSTVTLHRSDNADLNSDLLDDRLKGIDVNVDRKKSVCICQLLGCTQCKDYFKVEID